ncbi:MAG: hydroxyethylthiazole kinase [Xanthobacteraceae bacterium]
MHAPIELADIAADVLARVRERAPRVHCITNSVAQQYTANMLLAAGAVPSMTISAEEIGAFVAGADALLVNLGTFDRERRSAIEVAVKTAAEKELPWLLDPVFVDRSPGRAQFGRALLTARPSVVRLNHTEFAALSGNRAKSDAAARFAQANATIVALTGDVDIVSDGRRRIAIANGDPLMAAVTAMGCAGAAFVCAALAAEADTWLATLAALAAFGVAGELAAQAAQGPGSFAVGMIDALHRLDRATLRARVKAS